MSALLLMGAATGAARDAEPVSYTCANGTKLQATFSPPSVSTGLAKLVYAGSATATILTQSVSRMLVEMGSKDGERFAKRALIKFAKLALSGAPQVGGMNISTFTSRERHALARASAIVLATLQADTSRPQ
jgi:hypothetical protein